MTPIDVDLLAMIHFRAMQNPTLFQMVANWGDRHAPTTNELALAVCYLAELSQTFLDRLLRAAQNVETLIVLQCDAADCPERRRIVAQFSAREPSQELNPRDP